MAKFWRVMGIILIVLDVIGSVVLLVEGNGIFNTLLMGFFSGLGGGLMIAVGGLIERTEGLEAILYTHSFERTDGPRKTCPRCEREYDAAYTSCPYCGCRD